MSREMSQDVPKVYRVRLEVNLYRSGEWRTEWFGPYQTLGAARGQATSRVDNYIRYGRHEARATVESSPVTWTDEED